MSLPAETSWQLDVRTPGDLAVVRSRARRVALLAGLDRVRASELAIAASEAASNLIAHAGGGTLRLRWVPGAFVELETQDEGPGIVNVESALRDHMSRGIDVRYATGSRSNLGLGLGVIRRLTDDLTITATDRGTHLVARKRL